MAGVREGKESDTRGWGKEREFVEWELYKTQFSLSSMEKIKAHDRYKHICYSVTLVSRS